MMKNKRIEKFENYQNHPWYHRIYSKLKPHELEFARGLILEHDHLDLAEFERMVNRAFLDKPALREKIRGWKEISELLASANTSALRDSSR